MTDPTGPGGRRGEEPMERIEIPRDELERLLEESAVFRALDPVARAFVLEHLEPHAIPGGYELMHQGQQADCLYLVAVGRVRVTMTRDAGDEVAVAEIGRGEVVGEMALITNEPRSATVTALRDSHVLRLSTAAFMQLAHEHPGALRDITTQVVNRLVRSFRQGSPSSPVVTIAVVPLGAADEVLRFDGRLAASLQRLTGAARHVRARDAANALGGLDRVGSDHLASWFAELEAEHEAVVYEADPEPTAWTDACLRQADLVLLVASGRDAPAIRGVEQAIVERQTRLHGRIELVLVHPPGIRDPRGTSRWLAPRRLDRHHHVRVDRDGDVDRVARLLVGKGIGIVFSGGGARGIAEIGVLRALNEVGVPVDACGGTSIGSLMAGGTARGLTPDELEAQLRHVFVGGPSPVDITFPVISLASGRRVTAALQEAADGLDLEDAWRNLFCVSTNLSRGDVEIHRTGPGWRAIRASFSIPGVFPPVRSADGDLLVDGGVLDNMPVGLMRREHYGIRVVAVDVGVTSDVPGGSMPDDGVVSGWKVLLGKLEPRRKQDTAGMARILMRLTELGSEHSSDLGDVYVRPAVDPYGILEFGAFDRLLELGYEAGRAALDTWLSSDPAPVF